MCALCTVCGVCVCGVAWRGVAWRGGVWCDGMEGVGGCCYVSVHCGRAELELCLLVQELRLRTFNVLLCFLACVLKVALNCFGVPE